MRHTLSRRRQGKTALAVGLILGFVGVYVWATYTFFTTRWLGGNDLFVVWRAVRAWLVEGQDPYSQAVTRTIQLEMLGRLAGPDEHQFGFAYPLGIVLFVAPLLPFPFPLARAIWMVWLQGLMVLFVLAGVWPRRPRPIELAVLVGVAFFFYPTARAIILGQPAVLVAAAVATTLWALRAERDWTAGVALGLTTLKPQMVLFFVPAVLWWAWRAGRRGIWWGFGATLLLLTALPMLIYPTWPLGFLAAVRAYAAYTGRIQEGPMFIIGDWVGAPVGHAVAWGGSAALLVWLIWRLWTSQEDTLTAERAFLWSLIVTMWTAWRTATTNQIVGLLPVLAWWRDDLDRRSFWLMVGLLLVVPWWVFLATLVGDAEQLPAYVPVPVLSLLVMLAYEVAGKTGALSLWSETRVRESSNRPEEETP